jgi:uncharacterized protein YkwD
MRKLSLVTVALLSAVSAAPASAQNLGAAAQAAISHYRHQHGLGSVTADGRLMQLAQEQAHAMARAGVLDHSVHGSFATRVVSYNPEMAVENIAAGTRSFSSTLDVWKRSPGHNANLLKSGATRFGIASAAAPNSKYKIFWALIMAGSAGPRGGRHAVNPGLMRAAVAREPVVRVRYKRP